MNIAVDLREPFMLSGKNGTVAALEQGAGTPMPQIESDDISAEQPLHGLLEIGLWRLHLQMKVIFHQTIRVQPNRVALRQRKESGEKIATVGVVTKYLPLLDPAAKDMIPTAFDFNSQ